MNTALRIAILCSIVGASSAVNASDGNTVESIRALVERDGKLLQPVAVEIEHTGADQSVVIHIGDAAMSMHLKAGDNRAELLVSPAAKSEERPVTVEGTKLDLPLKVLLQPVRRLTIYLLPHSHHDIGYTDTQAAVEKKQIENLRTAIAICRRTADYPPGARFKWNAEVLWSIDSYLRQMPEPERAELFDAIKKGSIGLNGMYLNELTGLCRPEELLRLFHYSGVLAKQTGVTIDSAMISDVPGYTWGTVTAMHQAGIRYFSPGPNYCARIGTIMAEWENRPFWWVSPTGRERVLTWVPNWGYCMSHVIFGCDKVTGKMLPSHIADYQDRLDKVNFPYDITYLRWGGYADNDVPDGAIADFVRDWNAKYAYPKFIIATTSEAFRAFEEKYGAQLPEFRGDWTPYWEDGAGSSALETAMNRNSSDRLVQAETLFALRNLQKYPAAAIAAAWRNVLLYSEHTWGAACSVWDPENEASRTQWEGKRAYAVRADAQTRELLNEALPANPAASDAIDVYNSASWDRTGLVVLSRSQSAAGDRVCDAQRVPVPSQRLRSGELIFMASNVPMLAAKRYRVFSGAFHRPGAAATATGAELDNGIIHVRVDEKTGAIAELTHRTLGGNFVDSRGGEAINDYRFLPGDKLADLQRNGPVKITVHESGPLIASLLIESEAPGCNKLTREVRLVAGCDYVELINTLDKKRAAITPKPGDWDFAFSGGKESVNFAFPFNVKNGVVRLDIPLASMRPEVDQIPGSCKNWLVVNRWVDVANADRGITWVTLDAPLIDVGAVTAKLIGPETNDGTQFEIWRKHIEPTQTLYSWVMNNHWYTNYRAYQEGLVTFRYVLRPHRGCDPAEATRFAVGFSQPLLAGAAHGSESALGSPFRLESRDVVITALKRSDDGRALVIRLLGASGKDATAEIVWRDPKPTQVWLSDSREQRLCRLDDPVLVPGSGVVTLRADLPQRRSTSPP
jgi:hypothetical protein